MKKKIYILCALILVFSMLFTFSGCLFEKEEEETTTTIKVRTPLPTETTTSVDEQGNTVTMTDYSDEEKQQNKITVFEYFNLHINEAKDGKAAVSEKHKKSIGKITDENGDSISMSDNSYINSAISVLKGYMLENSSDSIEYGDDLKAFLPVKGEDFVSNITLDEVESLTCVDKDLRRTVTVNLKSPTLPATIEKAYDIGNIDDVMAEMEKASGYIKTEKPVLTYTGCSIVLVTDIETDEVISITYVKGIDVSTTLTGEGTMESIGTLPICFHYQDSITYSIDRTEPVSEDAE